MSQVTLSYRGDLRTEILHPSGQQIATVASAEHGGPGDGFSPTDLLAAALGSCILTIIGMIAERKALDLGEARVSVAKETDSYGTRIVRLATHVSIPTDLPAADRRRLERAAATCPVHHALDADIEAPITFTYGTS